MTLAGSGFDTLLAVYVANPLVTLGVSALVRVAQNNNCSTAGATATYSCLTWNVVPNLSYWVQVDGGSGERGNVVITLNITSKYIVPNDLFSAAVTMSTIPASVNTLGATTETGEPNQGTGTSGTVWYRFSAPVASVSATVRKVPLVAECTIDVVLSDFAL